MSYYQILKIIDFKMNEILEDLYALSLCLDIMIEKTDDEYEKATYSFIANAIDDITDKIDNKTKDEIMEIKEFIKKNI